MLYIVQYYTVVLCFVLLYLTLLYFTLLHFFFVYFSFLLCYLFHFTFYFDLLLTFYIRILYFSAHCVTSSIVMDSLLVKICGQRRALSKERVTYQPSPGNSYRYRNIALRHNIERQYHALNVWLVRITCTNCYFSIFLCLCFLCL